MYFSLIILSSYWRFGRTFESSWSMAKHDTNYFALSITYSTRLIASGRICNRQVLTIGRCGLSFVSAGVRPTKGDLLPTRRKTTGHVKRIMWTSISTCTGWCSKLSVDEPVVIVNHIGGYYYCYHHVLSRFEK